MQYLLTVMDCKMLKNGIPVLADTAYIQNNCNVKSSVVRSCTWYLAVLLLV